MLFITQFIIICHANKCFYCMRPLVNFRQTLCYLTNYYKISTRPNIIHYLLKVGEVSSYKMISYKQTLKLAIFSEVLKCRPQ